MNLQTLQDTLGWCTVINYGVLLFWFIAWVGARDWIYALHSRLFSIARDRFEAVHYTLMGTYKLLIFAFNLAPYLALRIAS